MTLLEIIFLLIIIYFTITIIFIGVGTKETLIDTEDFICCLFWIVVIPIMIIEHLTKKK